MRLLVFYTATNFLCCSCPGIQNEAPVLYPRMDLPGPVRIMDDDVELIAKARDFASDMIKSPYYITPKHADRDVERYWDVPQEDESQRQSLASQLSPVMKAYLPPELFDRPSTLTKAGEGGALPGLKPLPAFDVKSLSALEDKERKNAESGGTEKEKEKEKEDAGVMSDIEGELEEEEQDDDYAVDHYDSADESAADDEPAAVF